MTKSIATIRRLFNRTQGLGLGLPLVRLAFYKECVHCGANMDARAAHAAHDVRATHDAHDARASHDARAARASHDAHASHDARALLTPPQGEGSNPLCPFCTDAIEPVRNYCTHCGRIARGISGTVSRCDSCRESPIGKSRRRKLYIDYTESSYYYRGSLRSLLLRSKLQYYFYVGDTLANLVELRHMVIDDVDIICHIPTHITRRLTRFRHPNVAISSALSHRTGIPVGNVLRRGRRTKYQTQLVRHTRRSNVEGAFRVVGDVDGLTVLLVDDILTTGSTANECAKVLKAHGASCVKLYTLSC